MNGSKIRFIYIFVTENKTLTLIITPKRMQNTSELDFSNTEIAFQNKSDQDIQKAYWLFKIIGNNLLTKIGPPMTNFALNIGLPITGLIKKTIFHQFCGGESIEDCKSSIEGLQKGSVGAILDYSVEGEDSENVFNETCAEILRTVQYAKNNANVPITVFKMTGIGRFGLYEKLDAQETLTATEQEEWNRVQDRVNLICSTAHELQIPVMIDAEESWIQKTIDQVALDMMRKYNRERIIVYNTYQMYRHDKLADLKADYLIAQADGFILGAKLVRGAYMEKERKRATEMGYQSPIQPNKEATDKDYDLAVDFCVQNLNQIALVAGTHNELSCKKLTELLSQYNISRQHPHVYFSQLYGMSDHLSFNLSNFGYNVVKYLPYGPVKAVMPYLFRRAQENTSISGQTSRELQLLITERKRRKN